MWRKIISWAQAHQAMLMWWGEIVLCMIAAIGWALVMIFLIEARYGG